MTREVYAKYGIEDSVLVMQWKDAGTTEETVRDDIFVVDNHGVIVEYAK